MSRALLTGSADDTPAGLNWFGIVRLGLVQAAIGAVVVVVTSTLNRVMVVEYALPAVLPGILVALHYAVQMIRPRFGFASDVRARRTPWIVGGMSVLALGGILCAESTVQLAAHPRPALLLAVVAYVLVGLGVGAAGTSLLVLLAKRVQASRRAAAATIMWILMIAGFAVTSSTVGHFLDPFSPRRLIFATAGVAAIAWLVAVAALSNLEGSRDAGEGSRHPGTRSHNPEAEPERAISFAAALRRVWAEPTARRFTLFVFVSMLAYSAQELLLEPFAGLVFDYSVGESAQLSGLWHAAALVGMIGVGVACSSVRRLGTLRGWTIGGCIASAVALLSLAAAGIVGPLWPLRASAVLLGVANGAFAIGAIGSMMELSHAGGAADAGVRMGLWGGAQAIAFAIGGLVSTAIVDIARHLFTAPATAFAIVFAAEASLFLLAARCVAQVDQQAESHSAPMQAVSL